MLGGVVTAATVAHQLAALDVVGLISKIRQAARTAQQNKKDCENLACRVGMLQDLLLHLQEKDPEAMRSMAGLEDTLKEAHDLVVSCQVKPTSFFFKGNRLATKFHDVEKKIDMYLSLVPLISHINTTSRLDRSSSSNYGQTEGVVIVVNVNAGPQDASVMEYQQNQQMYTEYQQEEDQYQEAIEEDNLTANPEYTPYLPKLQDGGGEGDVNQEF